MKIGDYAETTRTFSESDVKAYSALCGGVQVGGELPEPLIGALISQLLGIELPGRGTNYLKQESEYLTPALIGEPLRARVEITQLRLEKNLVDLKTTCHREGGETLFRGRALVHVSDVE